MESIITRLSGVFKLGKGWENIGIWVNKSFYFLIVIILLIGAFFIGKLSRFMEAEPVFAFYSKEEEDKNFEAQKDKLFGVMSTKTIVASITGKRYYFVWCKGAANLKESKKIYFDTEAQAQARGYTIAANCK